MLSIERKDSLYSIMEGWERRLRHLIYLKAWIFYFYFGLRKKYLGARDSHFFESIDLLVGFVEDLEDFTGSTFTKFFEDGIIPEAALLFEVFLHLFLFLVLTVNK
jgi:hypothetical protein